jgi:hypothetical protein
MVQKEFPYVAPATASSTVLDLVRRDNIITNKQVAAIITPNLEDKLRSALHIITGAKRRKMITRVRSPRTAWSVKDRGNMCTRGSFDILD